MQTNWNPSTARPILNGVPLAVPSQKTIDRTTSIYYMAVGSLAEITQSGMKDLLDKLSERRDLFRHAVKYRMKEAYSRSESLMDVFGRETKKIGQYQLWLDITDCMENELRQDVMRLYYTTDNILLKHNPTDHEIRSLTVVVLNLCIMLHDVSERYDEIMRNLGIGASYIKPSQEFLAPMYGMYASMREVADMLVKDRNEKYYKEGGAIYKALEIIALKVCDIDRIDRMANEGLKLNGVYFDGEGSKDNSFTPWTNTQVSFLIKGYNKMTDEELAKTFGRSVGAVRAKARQLKLKRGNKQ